MARAKALGADHAINHYADDILEEVKTLTDRRGVDVVIEHVGRATWDGSVKALTKGGRLVTCGATTGAEVATDLRYIYNRELTIYGSYMAGMGELLEVVELFKQGKLKPVVDSVFPLKKAAEAQTRLEGSKHFGKIVLKI